VGESRPVVDKGPTSHAAVGRRRLLHGVSVVTGQETPVRRRRLPWCGRFGASASSVNHLHRSGLRTLICHG
jgi:hypothetical protein